VQLGGPDGLGAALDVLDVAEISSLRLLVLQQVDPCPGASPPSKSDMTRVPFTDDNGNPILGPDGSPMMRPEGFDPHFFTAAGAADAARYGQGTYYVNSLSNFKIGGAWDAQRGANESGGEHD
jgi:hypothetical protein